MSEYVTSGAIMTCTCGLTPSQLQVTSNTSIFAQDKLIATVSDKVPMVNIMPFGTCKMKPTLGGFLPCIPSPTVWMGSHPTVQIPGGNPLLKTSKIMCALGGMIQFQNSGQMKPDKAVIKPTSPQIKTLKKAAQEAVPFCEECEKKEKKKTPKIIQIYWIDEKGEPHKISELTQKQEVTLCVDVEEGGAGSTVNLTFNADEGKVFKDGSKQMVYKNLLVEDDNTAYIDNFKVEYKNSSK